MERRTRLKLQSTTVPGITYAGAAANGQEKFFDAVGELADPESERVPESLAGSSPARITDLQIDMLAFDQRVFQPEQ